MKEITLLYKDKFIDEYNELKNKYNELKSLNNKIEAYHRRDNTNDYSITEPKHDSPYEVLLEQQRLLEEYIHILELRAIYEKIDLGE